MCLCCVPALRDIIYFLLLVRYSLFMLKVPFFFFFHSVLRWSVAMSTIRRQSSRIAAFQYSVGQGLPVLHEARCGYVFLTVASNLEAASGSPQRQHSGGPLVVSCGQYLQRAANLSVTRWERGWHPVVADFHIRYMASIWYPQDLT